MCYTPDKILVLLYVSISKKIIQSKKWFHQFASWCVTKVMFHHLDMPRYMLCDELNEMGQYIKIIISKIRKVEIKRKRKITWDSRHICISSSRSQMICQRGNHPQNHVICWEWAQMTWGFFFSSHSSSPSTNHMIIGLISSLTAQQPTIKMTMIDHKPLGGVFFFFFHFIFMLYLFFTLAAAMPTNEDVRSGREGRWRLWINKLRCVFFCYLLLLY